MTEFIPLQPLIPLFNEAERAVPNLFGAAHLVADGEQLLSTQSLPGVTARAEVKDDGIHAELCIAAGIRLEQPIHLCFGMHRRSGQQRIHLDLLLEPGAEATLLSHCLFSAAGSIEHSMEAHIRLLEGARLYHQEAHYHGRNGRIRVTPNTELTLARGAHFRSEFSLIRGRVGELSVAYQIDVGEEACAELDSRIYGSVDDQVRLSEHLELNGRGARGLVKSRVAVSGRALAEVFSVMAGNAAGSRGHVDCMEIVRDQARVSAVPEVRVSHPQAKVTHEAAIGSVDSHQLESLMARGLAPDEAVDMTIRAALAGPEA